MEEYALFLKICGAAILSGIACLVLSEISRPMRVAVRIGGMLILCGGVLLLVYPIVTKLRAFLSPYALSSYAHLLLKCLGIAFLAEFVSDICRELGEGTLATLVETAGKCVILLLAVSPMEDLFEICAELMK